MEEGVVPPPRRGAPRSLTGPPRQGNIRKFSPQTMMSHSNQPGPFVPLLSQEEEIVELRAVAAREIAERAKLQNMLKDEVARMDCSMHQQRQLEEELVSKDAMIDNLSSEIRLLKQKKQSVETELAQSTADYMNSQASWLEKVSSLNDEVQLLKLKLHKSQEREKLMEQELTEYREQEIQNESAKRHETYPDESKNVKVAADALEKHQNELLIKELRALHSKLREEMQELRDMNERLKDDNEHYQYLLVENTINGKLTQPGRADGITSGGSSAASSRTTSINMTSIPEPISTNTNESDNKELGLTLADDEILYDMNNLKSSMNVPSSIGDEESITSLESSESLQKIVNQQQFELRSLNNYNKALRLSLERLVDRLLENKSFSRAVEETISKSTVQTFRSRVASYSDSIEPAGSSSNDSFNSSQHPASLWTDMIFNAQYTGAPNRRVISLGVDNEFKAPPQPTPKTHQARDISTGTKLSDEEDAAAQSSKKRYTGMRYVFGHPKSFTPAVTNIPQPTNGNEIHVAKRTDSLTEMRKLKLTK